MWIYIYIYKYIYIYICWFSFIQVNRLSTRIESTGPALGLECAGKCGAASLSICLAGMFSVLGCLDTMWTLPGKANKPGREVYPIYPSTRFDETCITLNSHGLVSGHKGTQQIKQWWYSLGRFLSHAIWCNMVCPVDFHYGFLKRNPDNLSRPKKKTFTVSVGWMGWMWVCLKMGYTPKRPSNHQETGALVSGGFWRCPQFIQSNS